MGLTVGYTSSIRECALLIGVSCPLKKDDVKEMDNYWPRLALAGTAGNLLTRTTILISFLKRILLVKCDFGSFLLIENNIEVMLGRA